MDEEGMMGRSDARLTRLVARAVALVSGRVDRRIDKSHRDATASRCKLPFRFACRGPVIRGLAASR